MPAMFRPTAPQLFIPHPPIIDYIPWPRMRDNLVKHWRKYDRIEAIGLFFCTSRVRDTPNSTFIIRDPGTEPYADPDFLRRASSDDGWALLEKFWTEYPEVVEGMDRTQANI